MVAPLLSSVKHYPDGANDSLLAKVKCCAIQEWRQPSRAAEGTGPSKPQQPGRKPVRCSIQREPASGPASGRWERVDLAAGEEQRASGMGAFAVSGAERKVVTGIN